ncbi:MAG: HAD family hydrolase [Candidatus Omnitrophica bacterium]|nr:HAD family hydrolase [Candidatus Omnitrophota bacterium]
MPKVVIFDIDGTMVNAYKAIEVSLNYTLRKLGYPRAGLRAVRASIGHGDKDFVERFVKPEDVKRGLSIYRIHHRSSLLRYSRAIPGAKKVLNVLKKKGYKLAVASNRPLKFSRILLRHLGLERYFDVILCAKGKADIKPNPHLLLNVIKRLKLKKADAVYVGDMAIDVCAGRNAGIRVIAISGGSSSRAELKKERPFKIVSKPVDILKYMI